MNLTDNEILKFQRGGPVLFEDICAVYSVTLGEIIDEGYDNFQQYLSILTSEKPIPQKTDSEEVKQLLESLTDFQYLLLMASLDKQINILLHKAFHFFTHSDVLFMTNPPQIIVGPVEEKHIITEDVFRDFQRLLKRMYFLEQEGDEIIIYPDDPPATKKLKMQMRVNRERVRRAKAAKAAREKTNLKFSDLLGSITINHCGLSMANIYDITYYAFHDQLRRMGWRDQFEINHSAALAGAKIQKDQLKHWMRSIASDDK